jgi:hypothetical protein
MALESEFRCVNISKITCEVELEGCGERGPRVASGSKWGERGLPHDALAKSKYTNNCFIKLQFTFLHTLYTQIPNTHSKPTPKIQLNPFTMPAIPTSTSVSESAVIDAPFSDVWHLIKLQDFSKFWSKLEKSEFVKGASPETDVVQWTFKDGQTLEVKQEEHSVSF